MKWLIPFVMLASPAWAQVCPPAPDHTARQADIYAALRALPSAAGSQQMMGVLWSLWRDAPDAKAQALLDEGIAKREGYDYLGSRDTLDALVEYCPDYAEGYNQRAFASFLRQDYAAALYDLDEALRLSPEHTAAMTGKALTLMGLGRQDEAQALLKQAVAINPWLRERAMIIPDPGQDI